MMLADMLEEDDPAAFHGDVVGAYLKAELRGRPVYARVPASIIKNLAPRVQKRYANMKKPMVKVNKAMYGLYRADKDWGDF